MSLTVLAALPFLGACLAVLLARFGKTVVLGATALTNFAALMGLLGHILALLRGTVVQSQTDWLPAFGLNLHFMLDGLGLLFALLILGIGLLIQIYARFYLAKGEAFARFYTYLMLFQGAMLGIVISDNILLLLIFWEMTSLSSFLLIGFWQGNAQARAGARMALAITGAGGLALFAGLLLLGQVAGSYDLSVILDQAALVQSSPLYLAILALVLIGAFTKSAQMPFHFWLPHAMTAPMPVSAYLHSATMVKAGVFLLARLWPVLAGSEAWFYAVATTGLLTMVYAAKVALFKDDLKAILAYSTVSHLGLMTFLLGLGTKAGVVAAVFHLLVHASFKAPLFMLVGIVDHAAHRRDITALGGLRRAMPIAFALAALASLSMAGLPPLAGFLSKEMALELAADTPWLGIGWAVPVLALIGALLSVAYSLRLLGGVFLGPVRPDLGGVRDVKFGLWGPPLALVLLGLALAFVPMGAAGGLVALAAGAVTGQASPVYIAHWHGLHSPALWMTICAFGGALIVLAGYPKLRAVWEFAPRGDGKRAFDLGLNAAIWAARKGVLRLHDGALSRYLAIAIAALFGGAAYAFFTGRYAPGLRAPNAVAPAVWPIALALLTALAAAVWRQENRVLALLLVGVVGLLIAAGFAYLSAPDLALTQIVVEVVTVILMLLALNILPKTAPRETALWHRFGAAVVALLAGLGTGALAYAMLLRDASFAPISAFHWAQSKPGAGGTNAVNTIIVDFRGYDTYGEIIVLGIAGLIISALAQVLVAAPQVKARLLPIFPMEGRAGDRHPMLMVMATRILLPFGVMIGVYFYLRGHNLPGGGFVAGLVFAIAMLLQYIASGYGWSAARKRLNYHTIIGAGVLVASATGLGSWIAGRPFLTSNYTYVTLLPLEPFELATAALFDLGVFLSVLGAVMLTLATLARMAQVGGETASKTPFDAPVLPRKGR